MSATTAGAVPAAATEERRPELKLTGAYLLVAFFALFVGASTGLIQALEHAGVNLLPYVDPVVKSYYHSVSLHGVMNVLVFTTFFICGFLQLVTSRALGAPLASRRLGWFTFWLMLAGLAIAAVPLFGNAASVMFTSYPPMKASAAYYIGLTVVVVGTWLVTLNLALTYRRWKRAQPGAVTPAAAYMSLVTMVMWTMASVGLAIEMLFLVIPWSLGLVAGTDPLLARVFFWLTGHPIVYFWLLPAYVSWYTLVPRQAGGRLFSDPMARVTFLLFLVLSTPVGLHHQYTDPGIDEGWKYVQGFLTFAVFFPSLLTYFNVVASLEGAGRARGGRGVFGWFRRLPWGDPSVAAQVGAMLAFAFGGVGGLINASLSLNLVVHNTAWVPGHLHLTAGTAVALTFMGITYWLVPHLLGRPLFSRRAALAQVWLWVGGMALFSHSMHNLGVDGMPRRTMISAAPYRNEAWSDDLSMVGVGGTLLFLSGVLYLGNLLLTAIASRKAPVPAPAFAESAMPVSPRMAGLLERWWLWVPLAAALVLFAYGPTIYQLVAESPMNVPGLRVW